MTIYVKNWKEELKTMLKDYNPKNIFNADETGLYYQCLPDKTLTLKKEKCYERSVVNPVII